MRLPKLLALMFASVAGSAAADTCRLALALAVDVSRSVDAADYVIQTEGLIAALEDPAIRRALFEGSGDVALAIYYWSGPFHQQAVLDWTLIRSPADLADVAALLRIAERPPLPLPTALGEALLHGQRLMDSAPPCRRKVLDVAGDGRNNTGISPAAAYASADFGALVVNGLAIGEHESGLLAYFETELRRGPGSFVELAPRQADFPPVIRRKLLRELAESFAATEPPLPPSLPARLAVRPQG